MMLPAPGPTGPRSHRVDQVLQRPDQVPELCKSPEGLSLAFWSSIPSVSTRPVSQDMGPVVKKMGRKCPKMRRFRGKKAEARPAITPHAIFLAKREPHRLRRGLETDSPQAHAGAYRGRDTGPQAQTAPRDCHAPHS